jgi:hypothetical protein
MGKKKGGAWRDAGDKAERRTHSYLAQHTGRAAAKKVLDQQNQQALAVSTASYTNEGPTRAAHLQKLSTFLQGHAIKGGTSLAKSPKAFREFWSALNNKEKAVRSLAGSDKTQQRKMLRWARDLGYI